MSDDERPYGPVEIAGGGRVIAVGGRQVDADGYAQRSGQYPTRDEFLSAVRAEEQQLVEDKRKLAEMAWWRRYAQRRAEREQQLFAQLQGDPAFPLPAELARGRRT